MEKKCPICNGKEYIVYEQVIIFDGYMDADRFSEPCECWFRKKEQEENNDGR